MRAPWLVKLVACPSALTLVRKERLGKQANRASLCGSHEPNHANRKWVEWISPVAFPLSQLPSFTPPISFVFSPLSASMGCSLPRFFPKCLLCDLLYDANGVGSCELRRTRVGFANLQHLETPATGQC